MLSSHIESSAGDYFTNLQGSLSWTVGEPMVETYSQSIGFLTQGFHQPLTILITGMEVIEDNVSTYPNPVIDFLHIVIRQPGEYQIQLFDLQGKEINSSHRSVSTEGLEQNFDLRSYASSLYLLRISSKAFGKIYSYKIIKN